MTIDDVRKLYEDALLKLHSFRVAEKRCELAAQEYLAESGALPDQVLDFKTWRVIDKK